MAIEPLRPVLRDIYHAALSAVDPCRAVAAFLRREADVLCAGESRYDLGQFRRVFLVGVGKAGVPMAQAVESILGDRLQEGLVVVKHGHGGTLGKCRVLEAGHPEPDAAGESAGRALIAFLDGNVTEDDLLVVVISGGGSALAPAPAEGLTLEDKREATSVLLRSGVTIQEMNTVRKHLSRLKGGRLLEHVQGAQVLTLILSDVVGDDLSSIASGPTTPDPTTFADCLAIVRKYELESLLPDPVVTYLQRAVTDGHDRAQARETPKPGSPLFARTRNVIVGSNILALEAAARKARERGFAPLILSSSMCGNTPDVAGVHVAIAREVLSTGHPVKPPCCLISGGETTVQVRGDGKGGRNQEFALWCAREIQTWEDHPLLFASLGSDGTDGPTDAAGAVAAPDTAARAARFDMKLQDYLDRNDSYHFFKPLGDLIVTGPTRTNVMDLRLILIA